MTAKELELMRIGHPYYEGLSADGAGHHIPSRSKFFRDYKFNRAEQLLKEAQSRNPQWQVKRLSTPLE